MTSFKVRDRVKTPFGTGLITEIGPTSALVFHDFWSEGHNAGTDFDGPLKYTGNKSYYFLLENLKKEE